MLRSVLVVLFLVGFSSVLPAGDQKPALDETSPDAVLRACLDRLSRNDFEGYIALLDDEEIRFQSGLLIMYGGITQADALKQEEEFNPAAYLLVRSINDLIGRSLGPGMTDELPKVRQQIMGTLMTTTYDPNTNRVVQSSTSSSLLRPACVKASRVLRDPGSFLVKAIECLASPTFMVKDGEKAELPSEEWVNTMTALPRLNWDLYIRGSYAVAIVTISPPDEESDEPTSTSFAPKSDAPPFDAEHAPKVAELPVASPGQPPRIGTTSSATVPEVLPADPHSTARMTSQPAYPLSSGPIITASASAAPVAPAEPTEPRICFELTRRGKQWRITRLLPVEASGVLR